MVHSHGGPTRRGLSIAQQLVLFVAVFGTTLSVLGPAPVVQIDTVRESRSVAACVTYGWREAESSGTAWYARNRGIPATGGRCSWRGHRRREPECSLLYDLVQGNIESFLAQYEPPAFVARAFRGTGGDTFVGAGAKTDPQDGRPGTQPGNAAACFTQVAICASSSSSPSRMSM